MVVVKLAGGGQGHRRSHQSDASSVPPVEVAESVDVDLVVTVGAARPRSAVSAAKNRKNAAPTRPATSLPPGRATTIMSMTTMIADILRTFLLASVSIVTSCAERTVHSWWLQAARRAASTSTLAGSSVPRSVFFLSFFVPQAAATESSCSSAAEAASAGLDRELRPAPARPVDSFLGSAAAFRVSLSLRPSVGLAGRSPCRPRRACRPVLSLPSAPAGPAAPRWPPLRRRRRRRRDASAVAAALLPRPCAGLAHAQVLGRAGRRSCAAYPARRR